MDSLHKSLALHKLGQDGNIFQKRLSPVLRGPLNASSPLLNVLDQSLSKLIYFQPDPLNTLIATELF